MSGRAALHIAFDLAQTHGLMLRAEFSNALSNRHNGSWCRDARAFALVINL